MLQFVQFFKTLDGICLVALSEKVLCREENECGYVLVCWSMVGGSLAKGGLMIRSGGRNVIHGDTG